MKHYEDRTETRTTKVCVRRTCDLCGRETKDGTDWDGTSTYDFEETEVSVTVKCETGERYPSGGQSTAYAVDLCPNCFKDKLVPWLQGQGAKVDPVELDW